MKHPDFWAESGEWLSANWRGQLAAIRQDALGVTHVVWRGPLPAEIDDRLQPQIDMGVVELQVLRPDAKEYVVLHASRVLCENKVAVVDEVMSRERTSKSEEVVIVVERHLDEWHLLSVTIERVARQYPAHFTWVVE